jgi:hypothetical protein
VEEHNQLFHMQRATEKEISKARAAYEEQIIEHGCARRQSR